MAVARTSTGGGWDGVKIGLIVFIVLTVLSLTAAIILYTYQSDLQTAAADAAKSVNTANAAVNKSKQDMKDIGQVVLGNPELSAEQMQTTIKSGVQTISTYIQTLAKDEKFKTANIPAESSAKVALDRLQALFKSTVDLLNKTTAERDELNGKLAELDKNAKERADEFAAKIGELEKKYQHLEELGAANQQLWNQQTEDLKKRLESASSSASQQLASERQLRQQLEQQLEQKEARLKEMLDKLSKFQPTRETFSLAEMADGKIVRAVAGENIVYIGLGRQHRVQVGMPFSVYSAVRGPGPNQKEKATIEVTTVFDTTSEARVVSTTPGDPMLEGDLIANLVYDKNRRFNFVVAGDFDLDFDGKIDDPAGQKVIKLIEKWGGQIRPTVDTSIDFVILGSPPMTPEKPADTADDAAKQRAIEQNEAYKAFQAIKEEAKALSIPILTRTQFLRFMGTTVPSKVTEDQPAL